MTYIVAGIDVHKKMLVVAIADVSRTEFEFQCRRFGSTASELEQLAAWLSEGGVQEVVMESTAQYWKPVWLALEGHFQLRLAQAHSNRAPHGRKTDFGDTQRLVRRYVAGELKLSFVPEAQQREMRTLTRRRVQLTHDKVRIVNQLEALLEEARIKLSSVITDLLGASGRRILSTLAEGETDTERLAMLADERLKCTREQLRDALTGAVSRVHRQLLSMYLEQVELIDRHLAQIDLAAAEMMHSCQEAVQRLAEVPGIRVIAAQQIIAEAGPCASAFPSARQFSSWMGACPGKDESAGHNRDGSCPKGNRYLRRILCQVAQAAVRTKNSHFQALFSRLIPRLGYPKAIWAIVRRLSLIIWKILHQGARYIEFGSATTPQAAKRRVQRMLQQLRNLGYAVEITPLANPATRHDPARSL